MSCGHEIDSPVSDCPDCYTRDRVAFRTAWKHVEWYRTELDAARSALQEIRDYPGHSCGWMVAIAESALDRILRATPGEYVFPERIVLDDAVFDEITAEMGTEDPPEPTKELIELMEWTAEQARNKVATEE